MLDEQWIEPYVAPEETHSDEEVHIRSDTGWYKRVPNALNVQVTTGVPCTHTPNPLCERQNHAVEHNLDETGTYQRLGAATAVGCANHELTEELVYRFHPSQTVSWRTACLVLQYPLF